MVLNVLQEKRVATTKKTVSIFPFLKTYLRQSQPSTYDLEPKNGKMSRNMEEIVPFIMADDLGDIFIFRTVLFNFSLLSTSQI